MRIRLITWNIHKGIGGVDRRYRPERIIEVLQHYEPDIVLLQEVDDGVPRSRHHSQAEMLATSLGLRHQAYQRNVKLRCGHYGNAILSRFPLSDGLDLDLTIPWKKCRKALVARCHLQAEGRHRSLWLVNFHLGLAGFERRIQLRRFLAHECFTRVQSQTPLIAAGDFNDVWGTLGTQLLEPEGFRAAARRIFTFPAINPLRALDSVYYRGGIESQGCFAPRTKVARLASDHLPLVADFEVLPHQPGQAAVRLSDESLSR